MKTVVVLLPALLGCGAHASRAPAPASSAPSSRAGSVASAWDDFWLARKVVPSPPRNFLDGATLPALVLNLTDGAITDDVARQWVTADLRRGRGDRWATTHLRLDVANAGVFGPPGLNGTDRGIENEQGRGAIELQCPRQGHAAAGVIAVSAETQRRIAWAELTRFVIVLTYRGSGQPCKRILADGRTEELPLRRARGELSWQLDAGEFRDDPIVGPLWYQARGWSCPMDGSSDLDDICALVHPAATTSASADWSGR